MSFLSQQIAPDFLPRLLAGIVALATVGSLMAQGPAGGVVNGVVSNLATGDLLPGAVVAGLLVGIVFSVTSLLAPELAELSIFVLMALVLLVRPQGLFGKAGLMS